MKKLLSLFLAIAMLIAVVPLGTVTAYAASEPVAYSAINQFTKGQGVADGQWDFEVFRKANANVYPFENSDDSFLAPTITIGNAYDADITWQTVSGAASYVVNLYGSANGEIKQIVNENVANTTYKATDLTGGAILFAQILAIDANGEQISASHINEFTVVAQSDIFVVLNDASDSSTYSSTFPNTTVSTAVPDGNGISYSTQPHKTITFNFNQTDLAQFEAIGLYFDNSANSTPFTYYGLISNGATITNVLKDTNKPGIADVNAYGYSLDGEKFVIETADWENNCWDITASQKGWFVFDVNNDVIGESYNVSDITLKSHGWFNASPAQNQDKTALVDNLIGIKDLDLFEKYLAGFSNTYKHVTYTEDKSFECDDFNTSTNFLSSSESDTGYYLSYGDVGVNLTKNFGAKLTFTSPEDNYYEFNGNFYVKSNVNSTGTLKYKLVKTDLEGNDTIIWPTNGTEKQISVTKENLTPKADDFDYLRVSLKAGETVSIYTSMNFVTGSNILVTLGSPVMLVTNDVTETETGKTVTYYWNDYSYRYSHKNYSSSSSDYSVSAEKFVENKSFVDFKGIVFNTTNNTFTYLDETSYNPSWSHLLAVNSYTGFHQDVNYMSISTGVNEGAALQIDAPFSGVAETEFEYGTGMKFRVLVNGTKVYPATDEWFMPYSKFTVRIGVEKGDVISYEFFDSTNQNRTFYIINSNDYGVKFSTYQGECGHEYVFDSFLDPTCTDDGYFKYVCPVCDTEKLDTVDKLGHKYSSVLTPPTASAQGYTTKTCSRCNEVIVTNYVPSFTETLNSVDTSYTSVDFTADVYRLGDYNYYSTSEYNGPIEKIEAVWNYEILKYTYDSSNISTEISEGDSYSVVSCDKYQYSWNSFFYDSASYSGYLVPAGQGDYPRFDIRVKQQGSNIVSSGLSMRYVSPVSGDAILTGIPAKLDVSSTNIKWYFRILHNDEVIYPSYDSDWACADSTTNGSFDISKLNVKLEQGDTIIYQLFPKVASTSYSRTFAFGNPTVVFPTYIQNDTNYFKATDPWIQHYNINPYWTYQYALDNENLEWTDLERYDMTDTWYANKTSNSSVLGMYRGYNYFYDNAAMTTDKNYGAVGYLFTVPEDKFVKIPSANIDCTEIGIARITVNDEVIWPTNSDWQQISRYTKTDDIVFKAKAGDKIRFEMSLDNSSESSMYRTYVKWQPDVILSDTDQFAIPSSKALTYTTYDDDIYVLDCHKDVEKDVVIPESVYGLPVVGIDSSAFHDNTEITSITIPKTVNTIKSYAFAYCEKLENIYVDPENTAFCDVDGVLYSKDKTQIVFYPQQKDDASFVIPDSVTTISDYAFYGNTYLESITIPDTVKSIGGAAFAGCVSLKSVELPFGIDKIASGMFSGCSSLTEVVIPYSVTIIEDFAFNGCDSLESIIIPGSVCNIANGFSGDVFSKVTTVKCYEGTKAQNYCEIYLINYEIIDEETDFDFTLQDGKVTINSYNGTDKNVVIPETISGAPVTAIANKAFYLNRTITSVTIPGTVKTIGTDAFRGCSKLASVTFNDGLETIGTYAFGATALTKVVFPSTLKTIGVSAFNGVKTLTEIDLKNVQSIKGTAFANTSIGATGAGNRVVVPATVTELGAGAFLNCTSLVRVDWYPVKLASGAAGNKTTPSFMGCTGINEVRIYETAENIPAYAFYKASDVANNKGITTLRFMAGSKAKTIGDYAFYQQRIGKVVFPDTITKIGVESFRNNNLLKILNFGSGDMTIGQLAFSFCNNLPAVTIPGNVKTIYAYAFRGCARLETVVVEEGVEYISSYAFGFTGLKSITLPASITKINSGLTYDTSAVINYPAGSYVDKYLHSSAARITNEKLVPIA